MLAEQQINAEITKAEKIINKPGRYGNKDSVSNRRGEFNKAIGDLNKILREEKLESTVEAKINSLIREMEVRR